MTLIPLGQVPALQSQRLGQGARALTYGSDVTSWGELERRSNRRAWAMMDAGVARDDLVTLAVPNGSAFFEIMFALWKIGATPHVVSARLPLLELKGILSVANPRMVICDDPTLVAALDAKPTAFGLDHLRQDAPPTTMSSRWKAMSSGGSTGRPKIIVHPAPSGFDPDAKTPLRFPETGAILTTGPLYHNMPMTTSIQALFQGLEVVGMLKFDPEEALRLIESRCISWTSFVPTMMMRISRLPAEVRATYDVSSLRTVWHWAAPMPPELKQEWIDWLGAETIWEVYGGTEGIGSTVISGVEWLQHRGSVGRPINDDIKILDDQGHELPTGEVGEIFALPHSGQGSTFTYIGAEPRAIEGGFETLGDYGWLDEEGYLYIADRRTDMIVSGGANIFPAEVESALMAHPAVEVAVVIGLPDKDLGAVAHAIVKLVDPVAAGDEPDLAAFLADRLGRYKIPRSFEFVTEPLRDDAGKVRRQKLRDDRLNLQTA